MQSSRQHLVFISWLHTDDSTYKTYFVNGNYISRSHCLTIFVA
jgi:hypothetical protein